MGVAADEGPHGEHVLYTMECWINMIGGRPNPDKQAYLMWSTMDKEPCELAGVDCCCEATTLRATTSLRIRQ